MIAIERFLDRQDSHGCPDPGASDGSGFVERLESHLAQLNEQIARFSKLALQFSDSDAQDCYWELARDISRRAREIRRRLRELKRE